MLLFSVCYISFLKSNVIKLSTEDYWELSKYTKAKVSNLCTGCYILGFVAILDICIGIFAWQKHLCHQIIFNPLFLYDNRLILMSLSRIVWRCLAGLCLHIATVFSSWPYWAQEFFYSFRQFLFIYFSIKIQTDICYCCFEVYFVMIFPFFLLIWRNVIYNDPAEIE